MTDQPEIERQLGIASLPLFLISPAWGLNLPYIDNIAVLLQILINETFYGVSICCRVSNIFPTICYHYLWLVFDIPIIARIYPSLTSTSFLPSPVLYQQWMGGPGVVGWGLFINCDINITAKYLSFCPIFSLASSKRLLYVFWEPPLTWGSLFEAKCFCLQTNTNKNIRQDHRQPA